MGYQHAAVIARAATEIGVDAVRDTESTLIDSAAKMDPWRLRIVTRYLRHVVDPDGALDADKQLFERRRLHLSQTFDGVWALDGLLDSETGAMLRTALNALDTRVPGDARSASQRRADALRELTRRQLQGGALPMVAGERPHLNLTATVETMRGDSGAPAGDLRWAGPVPADATRRVACDAALTPMTFDARGVPLNVGRTRRTIPPSLRRAMVMRDRGCRFPGCDRPPEWCEGHHMIHWINGGGTDLRNCILLCKHHHRFAHERGLELAWDPDGALVVNAPETAPIDVHHVPLL